MLKTGCLFIFILFLTATTVPAQKIVSVTCKPGAIRMFWHAPDSFAYERLQGVAMAHPKLRFIMNGGMYQKDHSPTGLYVEKGRQFRPMKLVNNSRVNFGIQPQGVFGIRNGKAFVEAVGDYRARGVLYATQSAPMLVINGKKNPNLPKGLQLVRNGVGILADGRVLLAISEDRVNFIQFSEYFIRQGCTSALYLDGNVSDYWVPGRTSGGRFGVMIGVE